MTESLMPHPPAAAWAEAETPDHTRWTHEKAALFLKLLARTGKVAPSARAVGMSRQSAYVLRARAPTFASLWDHAMAEARKQRSMRSRAKRPSPLLSPDLHRIALPPLDAVGQAAPGDRARGG